MWTYSLQVNKVSPWTTMVPVNLFVKADVHSDASGTAFAGVVDISKGPTKITSGEFNDYMLHQDIQVKEGEVLRPLSLCLYMKCLVWLKAKHW